MRNLRDVVRAIRTGTDTAGGAEIVPGTWAGAGAGTGDDDDERALAEFQSLLQNLRDAQLRVLWHVERLQRGQEELLEFVRSVLDDESLAASGVGHSRRVAVVSLRVEQSEDVVRGLAGSFCDGVGLEVILQAEAGVGARGPYLAWRSADGRRLEDVLAAALAAVPNDAAADLPGLDELRQLLLALHEYGPGTIRIGPLILNRTPDALIGRVTSPWEMAALGATGLPGWTAVPSQRVPDSTCAGSLDAAQAAERWLRRLGPLGGEGPGDRAVVELTAWAQGYLGLAVSEE